MIHKWYVEDPCIQPSDLKLPSKKMVIHERLYKCIVRKLPPDANLKKILVCAHYKVKKFWKKFSKPSMHPSIQFPNRQTYQQNLIILCTL